MLNSTLRTVFGMSKAGVSPIQGHIKPSYLIAGYFPEVQIFSNFPNGSRLRKIYSGFRRIDCGIEILCTQQLQTTIDPLCKQIVNCVTLIRKQALRLLPASRCPCTHGDHEWNILYQWHSFGISTYKVCHVTSVGVVIVNF